jgi:propanol-preferring alcohol dehydrogenase
VLAYQLLEWGEPPQLREVEAPRPDAGEVVVRIGGAGACHSDLHIVSARERFPWQLPFTLGHENAGWIESLGAGVRGWEIGQPVAVYGPWGCGRCRQCRLSAENCCENAASLGAAGGGAGRDGGMAELMLVPSDRLLVPLGDLHPRDAAPLTDAGLTPYHAIKRALPRLGGGASAVVIGLGGLGHIALQLLGQLTAARVIAVDSSPEKVAAAAAFGADLALRADENAAAEIIEATGGRGADVVFDLVAAPETVALAGAVSRRGGEVSIVGLGGAELPVGFRSVASDCDVVSPYWGTLVELIELVELAERGLVRAEVERFPLTAVAAAYERMEAGTLHGRAVIEPAAT